MLYLEKNYIYATCADEHDVVWDNFLICKKKGTNLLKKKVWGWIDGLVFMSIEEAKEQLKNAQGA